MTVFIIIGIVLLLLNIYVNIRLIFSDDFNRFQKIAQSIMIWLLPFIGSSVVFYFMRDQSRILASSKYDPSTPAT
jgi:hypothetical protein